MASRKTSGPGRLTVSQELALVLSSDAEALGAAFWSLELARRAWRVHGARLRAIANDGLIEADLIFGGKT